MSTSLFGGSEAPPSEPCSIAFHHSSPDQSSTYPFQGPESELEDRAFLDHFFQTGQHHGITASSGWNFSNLDDALLDSGTAQTHATDSITAAVETGVRENVDAVPAVPMSDQADDAQPHEHPASTPSQTNYAGESSTIPATAPQLTPLDTYQEGRNEITSTDVPWIESGGDTANTAEGINTAPHLRSSSQPNNHTSPPPIIPPNPYEQNPNNDPPFTKTLRQSIREDPVYFGGCNIDDDEIVDQTYDPDNPDPPPRVTRCRVVKRKRPTAADNSSESGPENGEEGCAKKPKPTRSHAQRQREGRGLVVSVKLPEGTKHILENKPNNWPYDLKATKHLFDDDVDVLLYPDEGHWLRHRGAAHDTRADSDADEHDVDYTGHPCARGCKQCVKLNIPCSMLEPENQYVYPCQDCVDDEVECELLVAPKKKTTCENCKRRRQPCSYAVFATDPQKPCGECAKVGWKCLAGPAVDESRTRINAEGRPAREKVGTGGSRTIKSCAQCRRAKKRCPLLNGGSGSKEAGGGGGNGGGPSPPCSSCVKDGLSCSFEPLRRGGGATSAGEQPATRSSASAPKTNGLQLGNSVLKGKKTALPARVGSKRPLSSHTTARPAGLDLGKSLLSNPRTQKPAALGIPSTSGSKPPYQHKTQQPTPPPSSSQQHTKPSLQSTSKRPPPQPKTKTISTALSHPITFNSLINSPLKHPCHFCTSNPFYPILGHTGVKCDVLVQIWTDGKGVTELQGGFAERPECGPTRVCSACTYARARILRCAKPHEMRRMENHSGVEGKHASRVEFGQLVKDLIDVGPKKGASKMGPKEPFPPLGETLQEQKARVKRVRAQYARWCSICPAPAVYECCVPQKHPATPSGSCDDDDDDDTTIIASGPKNNINGANCAANGNPYLNATSNTANTHLKDPTLPPGTKAIGCGLHLCWACHTLFRGKFDGDLDKMIEGLRMAAPKQFYPRGFRADVQFLGRGDGPRGEGKDNYMIAQLGWRN